MNTTAALLPKNLWLPHNPHENPTTPLFAAFGWANLISSGVKLSLVSNMLPALFFPQVGLFMGTGDAVQTNYTLLPLKTAHRQPETSSI